MTFENVSNNPSAAPRTLRVLLYDGDGATSSAVTKTINVTNVNDPPVAVDDAYAVDEDTTLVVEPSNANLANLADLWEFDEGGSSQTVASGGYLASSGTLGSTGRRGCRGSCLDDRLCGRLGMSFDGAGDYVSTTSTDLKTASNFTLSAWFQTNTTTAPTISCGPATQAETATAMAAPPLPQLRK